MTNEDTTLDIIEDEPITIELTGTSNPDSFLNLTDTPNTYVGQGEKFVSVKDTEDGLEFINSSEMISWGRITGTLSEQEDLQTELDNKQNNTGNISRYAGDKFYLDVNTDTYILYNPLTLQVELYVGGVIKAGWG